MTRPLSSAYVRIFSPETRNFFTYTYFSNSFNFFKSLNDALINMVAILMKSSKLATVGLLKKEILK